MTDVFTKKKRSAIMAAIRSTGNKDTELKLAKIFRDHGITGWRRHQKVFGKPDFVFRKARLAIFVDGCFWHGCPRHGHKPSTNRFYWLPKLRNNLKRDDKVNEVLRKAGWKIMRIWGHELEKTDKLVERMAKVLIQSSRKTVAS